MSIQQLQEKCKTQLIDFLRENTLTFIEELFEFLTEKQNTQSVTSNSTSLNKRSLDLSQDKTIEQQKGKFLNQSQGFLNLNDDDDEDDDDDESNSLNEHDYKSSKRAKHSSRDSKFAEENSKVALKRLCRNFEKYKKCPHGNTCKFVHRTTEGGEDDDAQQPINSLAASKLKFGKSTLMNDESARKLIVDKLPSSALSSKAIFSYFRRFGRISNIEVEPHSKRASIIFSRHLEAVKAYQCPESMFGNRFVKIFWDADQSISEDVLKKEEISLTQSKPFVSPREIQSKFKLNLVNNASNATLKPAVAVFVPPSELMQQKEKLILLQIEQQKLLMEKLKAKNITEKDKQELTESIEKISRLLKENEVAQAPSPTVLASTVSSFCLLLIFFALNRAMI